MGDAEISRTSTGKALWPYFLLFCSMLFFASNYTMGRAVGGVVPPIGLSFWRWTIAFLILLPFTWRGMLQHAGLIRQHWMVLLALTVSLVVLGNTAVYVGLNTTTALNAAIVSVAQPPITIILTWLFFRDKVTVGQFMATLVAAFGILVTLAKGDLANLAALNFNGGDLWILLSVAGFSLYAVFLRKSPDDLPPLVLLNLIQLFGIAVLAPFYIWESVYVQPMSLTPVTIGAVLWAAIVVAIGAIGLWNAGIRHVGANKASVFIYIRMLLISALAILLLGEALQSYHYVACVLVVGGVYWTSKAKPVKAPA